MAGAATAPFPSFSKLHQPHSKRANILPLAIIALLCSASYLLGSWQNTGAAHSSKATILTVCNLSPTLPPSTPSPALDFTAHHTDSTTSISVKKIPACDAKYSEYTPCEDVNRSLKFNRDRLIYRERHCPTRDEVLKCLVPAPAGYKNPFPWPVSRGVAWFANVPHKELTVEKAVQNWIRVDGDTFRFPGGGTMFPNGADAYIDNIDRLLSLHDGSIRTAIDTGCGVSPFTPSSSKISGRIRWQN